MAQKVKTYRHNKTLDKMLLVLAALHTGKMAVAEAGLDDIIQDKDGSVEDDMNALDDLNQAAFEETQGEGHLEDAADDDGADTRDMNMADVDGDDDGDDQDGMTMDDDNDDDDEDEDVARIIKASSSRLKPKAQKQAKVSHARKIVANLAALRQKRK